MVKFTVATELTVIDRVTRRLRGIGNAFRSLGGGARRLNRGFGALGKSASGFLAPLGIVAGGGIAAGLTKLIGGTSRYGDTLAKTADRLGFTVEGLQEFRFAAERTGTGVEAFDAAMTRMSRAMAEAAAGKGEAAGLFDALGVSLTDAEGKLRSAGDLLPELADAFTHIESPAQRARVANALFGRSGQSLINMLAEGREGIEAYRQKARSLGLMTEEQARQSEKHQDALSNLTQAFKGLAAALNEHLLPPFTAFVERLTEFIAANKAGIGARLGEAFGRLAGKLATIDFGKVVDGMAGAIDGFAALSDLLGGVGNVLIALLAIMGAPIIKAILDIVAGFAGMAVKIAGWARKLALALAPFTLKILAAVAAVTLLAGIAALVVHNWKNLGKFLSNLWEGIRRTFFSLIAGMLREIKSLAEGISGLLNFAGLELPGLKTLDAWIADLDKRAQVARGAKLEIAWKSPAEILEEAEKGLGGLMDGVKARIGFALGGGGQRPAPGDAEAPGDAMAAQAAGQPPDGGAPAGWRPAPEGPAPGSPAAPEDAGLMERFQALLNPSQGAPVEPLDRSAARRAHDPAPHASARAVRARVEVVFTGAPPGTRVRVAARDPGVDVVTELDVGPGQAGAGLDG